MTTPTVSQGEGGDDADGKPGGEGVTKPTVSQGAGGDDADGKPGEGGSFRGGSDLRPSAGTRHLLRASPSLGHLGDIATEVFKFLSL